MNSGIDILLWIEGIVYPEALSGGRDQLHDSLCAFDRNRVRLESALDVDDGVHQQRIHLIPASGILHQLGDRWTDERGSVLFQRDSN